MQSELNLVGQALAAASAEMDVPSQKRRQDQRRQYIPNEAVKGADNPGWSHTNLPIAFDALLQIPLLQEIDYSDVPAVACSETETWCLSRWEYMIASRVRSRTCKKS
jgi:hypothetical protein